MVAAIRAARGDTRPLKLCPRNQRMHAGEECFRNDDDDDDDDDDDEMQFIIATASEYTSFRSRGQHPDDVPADSATRIIQSEIRQR